jgi:hypothetical protein
MQIVNKNVNPTLIDQLRGQIFPGKTVIIRDRIGESFPRPL